jgi:hypothetical protein
VPVSPAAPSAVAKTLPTTAIPTTGVVGSTASQANLQTLNSTVLNTKGKPLQASSLTNIDLGNGQVLSFDPTSMDGSIKPYIVPPHVLYDDPQYSVFTASDCLIMVEVPQTPVVGTGGSKIASRVSKQLIEANTLSISIHRAHTPARSFGYINPRGYARGTRTCAGTLILSKSTSEVLYRFLLPGLMSDLSKDTNYVKLDQLAPLDFTLLFTNEEGYASSQRLLGVEFVTDGSIVSVQDMFLEQQITWVAADLTPLAPLNFNSTFNVNTKPTNATANHPTPTDIIRQSNTHSSY